MESESFPVGMLMPSSLANSEQASTALYRRASSPGLRQGHIQLALRETPCNPLVSGAKTMFVSASATAITDPAAGSIIATWGAWPSEVAMPAYPL